MNLEGFDTRRAWLVLAVAVIVSVGGFLIASALIYHIGFPLDDSWIHQTYARNLALRGEWSFLPGQPSAGSTAPLWSLLLAFGYWLHLSPYIWTYLLGALSLFGLGVLAEATVRRLVPTYRSRIPWVGLFMVFEWHLAWAAASGMETLLHALLVTAVLAALMLEVRRYIFLGLLIGLSVWVRPDGLTLLGPVLLTAWFAEPSLRRRFQSSLRVLIGFGALFTPYLLFNLILTGTPMPNTFYAKQAEYAAWQARPLLEHLGVLFVRLFAGPAIVLLPGAVAWLVVAIRRRDWGTLTGMAWYIGYIGLYTARLPLYQHGRYIIPSMPVYFLWGLLAFFAFVPRQFSQTYSGLVKMAWGVVVIFISLGFWLIGANGYANDVGLIESEMVASAKWAAANLPPDAVIAAHDIGALGYFDQHQLVDLAGLISPDVVPFMRDQQRLIAYLDQRGVDYLIVFPDVYPQLVARSTLIFSTGGKFAHSVGAENMGIYRWQNP
jgi:hypothetical protein